MMKLVLSLLGLVALASAAPFYGGYPAPYGGYPAPYDGYLHPRPYYNYPDFYPSYYHGYKSPVGHPGVPVVSKVGHPVPVVPKLPVAKAPVAFKGKTHPEPYYNLPYIGQFKGAPQKVPVAVKGKAPVVPIKGKGHPVPYYNVPYIGQFKGSCKGSPDGLYYIDTRSFAFCSNGVKTIQNCAEGSANPAIDKYQKGSQAHYVNFCSINLLAHQG